MDEGYISFDEEKWYGTSLFFDLDEEILPESHINKSLSAKGSIAYKAAVFLQWSFTIQSTFRPMLQREMMARIYSLDLRTRK